MDEKDFRMTAVKDFQFGLYSYLPEDGSRISFFPTW